MISITTKYNRTAQQFFFLSNLAEWHFSCNQTYNKLWLQITGHLNQKEKAILNKLVPIFKKYDFDDENTNHYLGKPFIDYEEVEIWNNVAKWVNKEEFETLKLACKTFEDKFDVLWQKDKDKLKILSKKLDEKINKLKIKNVFEILENLFVKIDDIIIHVFAIPAKSPSPAGGANTRKGVITLELGGNRDIKDGILIALHEIAHQLFRQTNISISKIENDLSQKEKEQLFSMPLFKEQGSSSALEEIALIPFLPDGVLKLHITGKQQAIKLKKKLDINKRDDLENFLIYNAQELACDYINSKKKIDQNYVKFVTQKALEFARLAKIKGSL